MAQETAPPYVDSKTVSVAATPEVLTARDIKCQSVFLLPLDTNTGDVYVVDTADTTKKMRIPAGGLSLPIGDPANISIDVDTSGEGVEWAAV